MNYSLSISAPLWQQLERCIRLWGKTLAATGWRARHCADGYAISGLDFDKIEGDTLTLGVGEAGEVYNGIGRGALNIENMPVYRDAIGGVATPTSDEERTKFTPETTTVQININGYGPEMDMEETVNLMVDLLKRYAQATNIQTSIVSNFD